MTCQLGIGQERAHMPKDSYLFGSVENAVEYLTQPVQSYCAEANVC